MKKKVGVILAGCGVYDGSEVQETVLTLLALDRAGCEVLCYAPDKAQAHVVNHLTGQPEAEATRNVLEESARIVRGNVAPLAAADAGALDALILPGGYGAAKNLCDFAFAGAQGVVDAEVRALVEAVHGQRKPIGFICITPAIAAMVLGGEGVELTIGTDAGTAAALESLGARHICCGVRETHEDPERKVVSTPAYMLGETISEVAEGIEKLVKTVVAWA